MRLFIHRGPNRRKHLQPSAPGKSPELPQLPRRSCPPHPPTSPYIPPHPPPWRCCCPGSPGLFSRGVIPTPADPHGVPLPWGAAALPPRDGFQLFEVLIDTPAQTQREHHKLPPAAMFLQSILGFSWGWERRLTAAPTLFLFFLLQFFCQNAYPRLTGFLWAPGRSLTVLSPPFRGAAGGERLEMQNLPCVHMLLTHQSGRQ